MAKRIYAGNLSFNTTEETLRTAFESYGEVSTVTIIKNRDTGASKGFGFVEMPDDDEAFAAIRALNGNDFEGRKLRVNVAEDREKNFSPASLFKKQY